MNSDTPWSRSADDLLADLKSAPRGLDSADAAERLRTDGPNSVTQEASLAALPLLLRQFQSPLVLILVFAALVAGFVQEWLEAAIILVIVLGSTLLGFAQEYRASAAVAELRRRLALSASVLRDGKETSLPFSDIVAGDVIRLSAGAVVPADAVVLQASDLLVSEASLTGESFPVEKRAGLAAAEATLAQRTNMVFLGSSVRSGSADALVVATGKRTQFGAIAERLKARPAETDFARGVRLFGVMLVRVMVVVVLFVLTVNQLLGRPFLESLLFAVALGVGLSPELLPAIVSVTLSAGARRLATEGVIVRRLEAIENLGGMTVFCTDKTGTLTEGQVVLDEATDPEGARSSAVAQLAFLNASFETGIANPLDAALVAAGEAAGLNAAGYEKLDECPYDFTRKRLTIVVRRPGDAEALMITKGAFDNILPLCRTIADATGEAPLDAARRSALDAYYQRRGEEGFRVLAIATRRLDVRADYTIGDETRMCFAGFLVFMDPPKPEAAAAIKGLAELGVAVKVISGDNRHVVGHVARTLGLDDASMITGAELAGMTEEALWRRAMGVTLFAEIDPQQKERIVRALQRTGHSVGYLGDGINDAPALYAADVGVSVESAVDVARESADVILLRRDLGVLRQGVEGGRRTFANTLKYIRITTSANFGNMVSMALAAPFLPFLPMAAKQILLNNFLSDMPSIAIASDDVDADQIARPQAFGVGEIQRFMIVFGLVSSAFDILTFWILLGLFHTPALAFQTAWFVVSLLTELAVVMVLRTHGPCWRSRPGRTLMGITLVVGVIALASPFLGPVSRLFDLAPLDAPLMAVLVAIVAAYLVVTELVKIRFFRSSPPADSAPTSGKPRSVAALRAGT